FQSPLRRSAPGAPALRGRPGTSQTVLPDTPGLLSRPCGPRDPAAPFRRPGRPAGGGPRRAARGWRPRQPSAIMITSFFRERAEARLGPVTDPQLLYYRPYRPRQVDARGPAARNDAHRLRAGDDRSGPRPDGPRARARHHDQADGGPPPLHHSRGRGGGG